MSARFDIIRLWEIPQERILNTDVYQLWPLAALMADVTVESTQAVAERIVAAPLERPERGELVSLLAALAGIRLPRQAVLNALRRNAMLDDLLRESSVVSEWIEEGVEKGMQQGMRATILRVLEGRFGTVDAASRKLSNTRMRRRSTTCRCMLGPTRWSSYALAWG